MRSDLKRKFLSKGGYDLAVGAFVLFMTNLAAIVVVAGIVMGIQGYALWLRGVFGLTCAIAVSILLMQPLSHELEKLRVRSMVLRLVKTLPVTHPHTFESTLRLDSLRVRTENDVIHVRGEGSVARDKVEGLAARLARIRSNAQPVVAWARCACSRVFSLFSKPVRRAKAQEL